jgi:hypothetical protein
MNKAWGELRQQTRAVESLHQTLLEIESDPWA